MKCLEEIFKFYKKQAMVNCKNGYMVYTRRCEAMIAIREDDIVMSWIMSSAKGGGTDMLDKLEVLSDRLGKQFVVSGIVNPILEKMVQKRGYIKDTVPFVPDYGMNEMVEIYKKEK